jgi:predicted ester cyclase
MTRRRDVLAVGAMAILSQLGVPAASLADDCGSAARVREIGNALLDRYASAINAHDTGTFPELFTEGYIQHSGRSTSGLAAQIENFQRILGAMPDLQFRIEDRIIGGDKVVARTAYSATHSQTIRGVAPTGKAFTFRTIDIWRVENGKFAEHWDLTDIVEVLSKLRGG